MNSIISWVGGKKALRDMIYQRMPKEFGRYIEVFGRSVPGRSYCQVCQATGRGRMPFIRITVWVYMALGGGQLAAGLLVLGLALGRYF